MIDERSDLIPLCNSADLQEGGLAVPFDVVYGGQTLRAFAIRFEGLAHAYLNRCTHVAMELDYQPDRFSTTPAAGCCAPRMAPLTRPTPATALAARAAAGWSRSISASSMAWCTGAPITCCSRWPSETLARCLIGHERGR